MANGEKRAYTEIDHLLKIFDFTQQKLEHENNSRLIRLNGLLSSTSILAVILVIVQVIGNSTLLKEVGNNTIPSNGTGDDIVVKRNNMDLYIFCIFTAMVGFFSSIIWGLMTLRGNISCERRGGELAAVWRAIIEKTENRSDKGLNDIVLLGETPWLKKIKSSPKYVLNPTYIRDMYGNELYRLSPDDTIKVNEIIQKIKNDETPPDFPDMCYQKLGVKNRIEFEKIYRYVKNDDLIEIYDINLKARYIFGSIKSLSPLTDCLVLIIPAFWLTTIVYFVSLFYKWSFNVTFLALVVVISYFIFIIILILYHMKKFKTRRTWVKLC